MFSHWKEALKRNGPGTNAILELLGNNMPHSRPEQCIFMTTTQKHYLREVKQVAPRRFLLAFIFWEKNSEKRGESIMG